MLHQMKGFHLNEGIHHIDHIGPLCAGLGIPLVIRDSVRQYELTKKYYPDLDVQLVDAEDLLPHNIIKHTDVLISSHFCKKTDWQAFFQEAENECGKKMRSIYCPHGNSDKGTTYYWMEHFADEDCVLLYGDRMIDFLKEKNVFRLLKNYVVTGNFRLLYYQKHRAFYTKIIQEEISSKLDPCKKKILYAPTWNEEETSFFSACSAVLDEKPDKYSVIVKLHPGLFIHHLGLVYAMISKYENRKDILFLEDFPLVFPLLDLVDIYVGDMSSVGYDFLFFNKPMYFLYEGNEKTVSYSNPPRYLFQAGITIHKEQYDKLYSIIQETCSLDHERFYHKRKEMFTYTFGPLKPFERIKSEIHAMLTT